ncbi:MAG: M48 family metalloprotease, partial [Gammaproteobacteria bacterium]|nr:M48 family metalloprotease [Gammaproteobacteria bacterium]
MKFTLLPWLLTAALLSPGSTLADTSNLPDLGDESGALISPLEERRLGEDFMRQARHQLQFIDDPELVDYLQSLGNKLVAQSENTQQPFRFFLVNNPSINAFAVPGGFITVHTGLVLAAETESELSAVLAHEIAHITQRHIPRMFAAQKRTAAPAMAALLAAILMLEAGHTEGGEAAIALSTASMVQSQINFTRAHEEEADRVGTQIMADAGHDPRAMAAMFKRMQSWGRLYETNLPEFLRTHPLTGRRIAESENRANQYPTIASKPRPDYE